MDLIRCCKNLISSWFLPCGVLFLNAISIQGQAQQNVITLSILDSKTNLPVAWTTVFSKKNGYGVVADKNGNCSLKINPAVTDTFIVSSIGYEDATFVADKLSNKEVNKIFLEHVYITGQNVVIKSPPLSFGFDLIKGFKKNFSKNYPHHPLSGYMYANSKVKQDSILVKDIDYVTTFYSPDGFEHAQRLQQAMVRTRVNLKTDSITRIMNPFTHRLSETSVWLAFLTTDFLTSFLKLDKKTVDILSVRSLDVNGIEVYKVQMKAKVPLVFSNRVSQVNLDLYISSQDFAVLKYKISYTALFDYSDPDLPFIDINGEKLTYSMPPGFRYDSITHSKEMYFRKHDGWYIPFYNIKQYRVYDEQVEIKKKGYFEEISKYYIYKPRVHEKDSKIDPIDVWKDLTDNNTMDEDQFWLNFINPDMELLVKFLDDNEP